MIENRQATTYDHERKMAWVYPARFHLSSVCPPPRNWFGRAAATNRPVAPCPRSPKPAIECGQCAMVVGLAAQAG